jgi:hypothetical protein
MFSRTSRYHGLTDIVDHDAGNSSGALVSTGLRLLPKVTGAFQHTIVDGDRLDQLAFLYYRRPAKWWRICDANPEFLSPLELLGRGPLRTVRIRLAIAGPPAWPALAGKLTAEPGVVRFRFDDPAPAPEADSGDRAVIITYNRFVIVHESALADLATAAGFHTVSAEVLGRAGKLVTVPPDVER